MRHDVSWLVWIVILFSSVSMSAEAKDQEDIRDHEMKGLRVTFIGHATVLIELNGLCFLTDPVMGARIPAVKREIPPGLDISDLPPLTAVLISHAHYDHFDMATLRDLPTEVPIILPPRTRGLAGSLGDRPLVELGRWEHRDFPGARVTAVPADHYGGRIMLDSLFRPASGYVIESGGVSVYFAGDTGSSNAFQAIGARFDLDLALLPIGAYRPRWIMKWVHMNPPEALDAFQVLGADFMVPIHWGTFKLSLEPMDEPVRWLETVAEEKGLTPRVIVVPAGESWLLPGGRQELGERTAQ
jgi:L-ascorbate metabolism protein UlaG (beta-lactamase superfamily)